MKSKTYRSASCCPAECIYLDWRDSEPCWGEVRGYNEEEHTSAQTYDHTCCGHQDYPVDNYIKETCVGLSI